MKLLLVEDNPAEARIIRELLKEAPPGAVELHVANRLSAALDEIRQDRPDIVMLDLGLPDSQGLATLQRALAAFPMVPFVVLTGLNDENFAFEAVRAGAQDYLVKGRSDCDGLIRTAHYAIERHRNRRELEESDSRKSAILESVLDAILVCDGQGRIIEANPAALRVFGQTAENIVEKKLAELVDLPGATERAAKAQDIAPVIEAIESRQRVELAGRRYDGREFPAELAISRIAKAVPPAFTCWICDITGRKQAESERDRFFTLSLDLLCIASADGYFHRLNPAFERTLGFTVDELLARPFMDFVHPDDRPATLAVVASLAKGEKLVNFENRYRCKDGSYRWLLWTCVPDPREGLLYASAHDITERRNNEAEIRELNASLERRVEERTEQLALANKELESFSYSVSHDLRAPLRHIHGYVEMLTTATEGQLADKPRRYLKIIADASQEMGRLIDDLLAFSRMSRVDLQEKPCGLDGLVQETIRSLEMATKDRKIDWKIAPLPAVLGDAATLRQVLANLIGNAVKYTAKRERAVIEIGRADPGDNGCATLFVRDNGAGFDMKYVKKLFGVFQRLHRSDEFEGTGIGLATVQRIIARHGGRVWAEGEAGVGATFYFTLKPVPSTAAGPASARPADQSTARP